MYGRLAFLRRAATCAVLTAAASASTLFTQGNKANSSGGAGSRPTFEACPEVSCKSKEELAAMFGGGDLGARPRRIGRPAAGAKPAAMEGSASAPLVDPKADCPLDREELGRRAWSFFHTVAAFYPEHPSEEERQAAAGLVMAMRYLYPCKHCRAQLAVDIEENPPRLGSREEFSLWMCEQHNAVNAILGKPIHPCKLSDLDERWRTGKLSCWAPTEQTAAESLGQAADDESTGDKAAEAKVPAPAASSKT